MKKFCFIVALCLLLVGCYNGEVKTTSSFSVNPAEFQITNPNSNQVFFHIEESGPTLITNFESHSVFAKRVDEYAQQIVNSGYRIVAVIPYSYHQIYAFTFICEEVK